MPDPPPSAVRLDKWLWAARFFKTRALAAQAVDGGRIEVNGEKPKRSRTLVPGDRLRIRLGPYEHLVTVRAVSERRGSAAVAAKLFEEDPASMERRRALREQHRLADTTFAHGQGKPTGKERRAIRKLKGKE